MVKAIFKCVLFFSLGLPLLSCGNGDNLMVEPDIEFYPDGKWSFSSIVAIDTTTFDVTSYKLRIPFCEVTNEGTIIVGTDVREGTSSDQTRINIGIVRSTDGGNSFSDAKIILPHTNESEWDRAMDGTILVDRMTGRIFVFAHRITTAFIWENTHSSGEYGFNCEYVYSDDDGITWSKPDKLQDVLNCDIKHVVSLFGGVGHGITMHDGTLVLPIQCKMAMEDDPSVFNIQSGLIYSKNGGKTWQVSKTLVPCYSSENMIVEYEPGKLMTNCKSYIGHRRVYVTSDMGTTWIAHATDSTLIEPYACQGSLHKIGRYGFFLNPMNANVRSNLTLQITDDYLNWRPVLEIKKEKCFGYSCLCNDRNNLYAAVESNGESIVFCRIINE